MNRKNCALLPYLLENLSGKPELCDKYENLCNEIKFVLSDENLKNREIEESIKSALNVGKKFGILTWTNDLIRLLFDYNNATGGSTAMKTLCPPEQAQVALTQPRRTQIDMPAIRELGQRRKSRNVRRLISKRSLRRSRSRMSRRSSKSKRR